MGLSGLSEAMLMAEEAIGGRDRGDEQADLESLIVGAVLAGERILALTGNAGTGKTRLLRRVMNELTRSNARVVSVDSVDNSPIDLRRLFKLTIGLTPGDGDPAQRFLRALTSRQADEDRLVLIVDDAQALAKDTLTCLATIASTAGPGSLPLQVVLCGRPHMWTKISDHGMFGAGQITARFVLGRGAAPARRSGELHRDRDGDHATAYPDDDFIARVAGLDYGKPGFGTYAGWLGLGAILLALGAGTAGYLLRGSGGTERAEGFTGFKLASASAPAAAATPVPVAVAPANIPSAAAPAASEPEPPAPAVAETDPPAAATSEPTARDETIHDAATLADAAVVASPKAAPEPPPEVAEVPANAADPAPALAPSAEPAKAPPPAESKRPETQSGVSELPAAPPAAGEATAAKPEPPAPPPAPAKAGESAPPPPKLSPSALAALLSRGDELLGLGDVVAARLLYERAAELGSALAATSAGKTYDPRFLVRIGAQGVTPDAQAAIACDRRGAMLGDPMARALLAGLAE